MESPATNKNLLPRHIEFERYGGESASLELITEETITEEDIDTITAICNQPDVKEYVTFQYATGIGGEYTKEDAETFVKNVSDGAKNNNNFSYLIRNQNGRIAGNVGAKINGGAPEIGYWSDTDNDNARGFITNAVVSVCSELAETGFSSVEAYIERGNISSQAVLERSGFIKTKEEEKEIGGKKKPVIWYRKELEAST